LSAVAREKGIPVDHLESDRCAGHGPQRIWISRVNGNTETARRYLASGFDRLADS
jgi:hypothetical protein